MSKLYQQALLAHHKAPIGFNVELANIELGKTKSAEGFNPVCGDEITIYARFLLVIK